jgi:DNA-binding response OmpR family regulator
MSPIGFERGPNKATRRDPLGLTWSERRVYDLLLDAREPMTPLAIAEQAWGLGGMAELDATLARQHVHNIRRKLGQGAIETVGRSAGYRVGREVRRSERAS